MLSQLALAWIAQAHAPRPPEPDALELGDGLSLNLELAWTSESALTMAGGNLTFWVILRFSPAADERSVEASP